MSYPEPPGAPLIAQASEQAVDVPNAPYEAWRRFRQNRSALAGLICIGALIIVAVFAPLIATHNPIYIPEGHALLRPSRAHFFGTDQLGRDIFSRVVYGARTSLVVGIGAALVAAVAGTVVGTATGYRQGWLDLIVMRIAEVFLVVPAILLAGSLIIVLGHGEVTLIAALGLVGWPMVARIARSSTLESKQASFVDAAKVAGMSDRQIVIRHVLPHALPAVIVVSVLSIGTAILAEAALSFLAVGVTEPTPSWGLMVSEGSAFLSSSPHVVLFPAAAVFVTVLSFVAVSDGVRDALGLEHS